MGKAHAGWMAESGIELAAACDKDPERAKAAGEDFPGIRTYTDYGAMLADGGLDLAVVILPHNLHAGAAIDCLNAGVNVVVEKPMCTSVDDADRMIAAAESSDKMLSVFHNRRHDGDFLTILDTVHKGLIGDVFAIEACIGRYGKPGTWWRSDKRISGGALYDWGAHFLDWILQIVPSQVDGVNGFFKSDYWTDVSNEDHTRAVLRFKNGCVADLEVSSLLSIPKPKWRILGTKGGIKVEWDGSITVFVDFKGHLAQFELPAQDTHWERYYENIAGHLLEGKPLAVTPEQSRRTISIMEAAEQSAQSGQTVAPRYA